MPLFWRCQIFLVSVAAFICFHVEAQPVVVTQPASVVGYSYQPWYKAWYKEEIESDLEHLDFNATLCPTWYKNIPEKHKLDYQYAMEVGELCDRLSENEADHYEAEKEYQSDLKKRRKLRDSLVDLIVKLSNNDPEKIEQLTARAFPQPKDNDTCYSTIYKTFSGVCVDPELDPNVKKYRRVFANACAQDWLDTYAICQQISLTCGKLDVQK